jgi:hypothetical protein
VYFNDMYANIADDDSMRSLFEFLLTRPNLDGFGHGIPPRSEFHKEQQKVPIIEQWLRDMAIEHKETFPDEQTSSISAKECYSMFNRWKRENNPSYELSSLAFGQQFGRLKFAGITCLKDEKRTKIFDWATLFSV